MLNCFEEISQNLEFFGFCPVVETLLDITPIFTGNDVSWVYFDLQNFGDMATYFFPSFFKIIFKARIKKKNQDAKICFIHTEGTACFFYISHDFPLHIVGVFFQSSAWNSVFSVAEHAT